MKKKMIFILLLISCLMLTACGNAYPNISQEQESVITEYAASLLLKYDTQYKTKIVDLSKIEEEEQEQEQQTPENIILPEETLPDETDDVISEDPNYIDGNDISQGSTSETITDHRSISELLGITDFSFDYTGYYVFDSYPEDSDEEFYVSMDAANGKKLIVFYFDVTNVTNENSYLDMLSQSIRYRLYINNGSQNNVLKTMLTDDLSNYQGEFEQNETKQLVLIIEVDEDFALAEFDSVILKVKTQDDSISLELH